MVAAAVFVLAALSPPLSTAEVAAGSATPPPAAVPGPTLSVSGDAFLLDRDETTDGDVYATVRRAEVDGTVRGDLWVVASRVSVGGTVERDLDAAAPDVAVTGTVGSRVRIAAWRATVQGTIEGDAVVLARTMTLGPAARVRGGLSVYGGDTRIEGVVEGPVRISGGRARIEGRIEGGALVDCDALDVGPGARIDGDLVYESRHAIEIPEGVVVGRVIRREPGAAASPAPSFMQRPAFRAALGGYFALVAMIAGGLLLAFFRPVVDGALERARTAPQLAGSFGIGLVALLASAVVGLAGCLLLPLALAVWSALAALAYFGGLVGKMVLGRLLLAPLARRPVHPFLALFVGVAVLFALDFVPVFGTLFAVTVMIVGMGASLVQMREVGASPRPAPSP